MQLSLLPALFLAATAAALPVDVAVPGLDSRATSFARVSLPAPANWMAGSTLYPRNIIAAYNAETAEYASAESWAAYILAQCQSYRDCTSCISYSGINSGSTGGRYWFGEVYRGGATTPAQYERETDASLGITNSIAYTVVS
ncbi:uncharacterized protein PG998_003703 [Apiospora kogelbergensis]|uniref:Uncharacterized protein n=1 Tax=Apiospora kogelbergensis TaxID=1337665 RepID=A0AAW0QUZ7_9PEZI